MLFGDAVTTCVIATVFGSCALLGLRYAFYALAYERVRLYLRRRGPGHEMYTPVVTEELWEGLGSTAILALTSLALSRGVAGACTPLDTSGCMRGWPHSPRHSPTHPTPAALDALFLLQLAWHGHCAAKAWAGLGRVQGLDAAAHHAATLAALCLAYWWGLLRVGTLALAVFGAASPLLSASKVLHCLDARGVKKAVFVAFTAAYFATRVVMVPAVVLPVTLRDAWAAATSAAAPGGSGSGSGGGGGGIGGGHYRWVVVAANGFLLALYGLSLFWFGRLLGILFTGKLDATPRLVVELGNREARRWQKRL